MQGREIRQALHDGKRIYSTATVAISSHWPGMLKQSGIDFVFIDTEHVPLGREILSWMCRTYAAVGLPPVVRIPCPDPFEATKVLDGGAGGIIGPYVETKAQARALVGAARYRPLKGKRLQEALDDPDSMEPDLKRYLENRNADTLLILNIESVPAIDNLDEILSVDGIDSVLIGPHDLSCSLGIPEQYDHPRFDEAVRAIFSTARKHNVGAGIHFWLGVDKEIEWSNAGGNLMMHASDLALFGDAVKRDISELKTALGDDATGGTGDVEIV